MSTLATSLTDIIWKRAHLIGRDVEEMLWIGGTVRHAASEGLALINQRNA